MNNMHEGPLLALLDRRYAKDKIYTFTGDILISINPYKMIQGMSHTLLLTLGPYSNLGYGHCRALRHPHRRTA
jgi:myosin heavy subunit